MKLRHIVLAAGVAIAAWLALFGDKAPATGIAEPVVRKPAAPTSAVRSSTAQKPEREVVILALTPRTELIGESEDARHNDGMFGSHNWNPPPPPPPPPVKPPPPPPPTAPALPFTYLGKKIEDGKWEVYLARGEQTFIVQTKSIIDSMYRVDSIQPPMLSLTYLPLNQVQTLNIGGID